MMRVAVVVCILGGSAHFLGSAIGATQTIKVNNESDLQRAVGQLRSGTSILLAPGDYRLSRTLSINGTYSDVTLRGATGNRDDVRIFGGGMTTPTRDVPHAIWIGGNVRNITIADLTVRDVSEHAILFNAGTESPTVSNVHFADAGAQFIKSNPGATGGVDNGVIEKSLFEYSTTAPSDYTNGVDVHTGTNWAIRDNVFRNIVGPAGTLAGPAVLVWNRSANTTTERNRFINCARSISYGLVERQGGRDHRGGVIRNNLIFRSKTQAGDVGIMVADSPGTQVLNNTVFLSGTYASPIEYRYRGSANLVVVNNIVDGTITSRDGATATERHSIQRASPMLFVDAAGGDLHLSPRAVDAIDRGAPLTAVPDDWDRDPRPLGVAPDIGADEFRPSGMLGSDGREKRLPPARVKTAF